ncbi:MAG: glucose-6-phosphate dehydrogenase [Bifidobacterium sp.]
MNSELGGNMGNSSSNHGSTPDTESDKPAEHAAEAPTTAIPSDRAQTDSQPGEQWSNPLRDPSDLRLPRIAGPCSLVIFGVTGDLSKKKLLPAIYDLANRGLLPAGFGLIGFGRRDWSDEQFGNFVKENMQAHCRTPFRESTWHHLSKGFRFVKGNFDDEQAFTNLSKTVSELDRDRGTMGNHAFYMSVPPKAFPEVSRQLAKSGLSHSTKGAWRRVIIEKPFGHDLKSAKELDRVISSVFDPDSVFRIDHYLGKETVQNLLALRFANMMFEPVWNANYVSHVQITMAEDIGIGGRAGYYDGIGAARDVIQNHLLQLMALTAMEEPVSFSAQDLTSEKTKVLSAIRVPKDLAKYTARGQYADGWQGSEKVLGYLNEKGIDKASTTETYAAVRLDVDTRRWAGVPFYLRTGKRLGKRVTEIALEFKHAPHLPFETTATRELGSNAIVIRIQPDEGVTLRFGAKVPGTAMEVRDVSMDFSYGRSFTEASPEAYERLILDVLLGDPPLFPTTEEVNLSWNILDPIEEYWSTLGQPQPYASGTWGPAQSDEMLERDGNHWRLP